MRWLAYFGGASTSGGIGTITGAIVGGLVMGVLNNGMSILGVGVDWQQAIKGLILLLAVVLDIFIIRNVKSRKVVDNMTEENENVFC